MQVSLQLTTNLLTLLSQKKQELRGTQVANNLGTCLLYKFNSINNYYVINVINVINDLKWRKRDNLMRPGYTEPLPISGFKTNCGIQVHVTINFYHKKNVKIF